MKLNREALLKQASKAEDKLFISKVLDKANQCEHTNSPMHTDFLDPHQRKLAGNVLSSMGGVNHIFHGGYEGAERVVLFFGPDFISFEEFPYPLKAIQIRVKGKESLSHRDYLGSLMGLGIKREKIGDILVGNDGGSIIVLQEIADYIQYNLTKIGHANIEMEVTGVDQLQTRQDSVKEIRATLASLRLDCVAGAGYGMSRTKVAEYIRGDKVNLNWEGTTDLAKQVKSGDVISIRGKGRIELTEVCGNTKKGRISVILKKYG